MRPGSDARAAALAAAFATVVATAVAIGCFSEHTPTTPSTARSFCATGATVGPDSALVTIQSFAFRPADAQVAPGTTVVWANCEPPGTPSHTSTADAGSWASPLVPPGQSYSHVFPVAGAFSYHCTPHPFMTGRVIVR